MVERLIVASQRPTLAVDLHKVARRRTRALRDRARWTWTWAEGAEIRRQGVVSVDDHNEVTVERREHVEEGSQLPKISLDSDDRIPTVAGDVRGNYLSTEIGRTVLATTISSSG